MVLVKSVLAGLLALLLSTVLFIGGLRFLMPTPAPPSEGTGSTGYVYGTNWIALFPWGYLIALLIFAAGFIWEFRRASR